MNLKYFGLGSLLFLLFTSQAQAQFYMSEVIVDFGPDSPRQHDVELTSQSKDVQYIASETYLVEHPTDPNEKRTLIKDPQKSGLMITPNKLVLPGGSRKLMRFLLLHPQPEKDQIFRVAVKPVVKGVDAGDQRVALKLLVGFEALIIIRPKDAKVDLVAKRKGNSLTLTNNGNTNANLQSGQQCNATGGDCKDVNLTRLYAGQTWTTTLPYLNGAVKFQVWDGKTMQFQSF